MTFGMPMFLYGLAMVPAMAIFMVWASRQRDAAIKRLGDPSLIDRLSLTIDWRNRRIRKVLWISALGLLIFSLARPQWGSEVQQVERRGVQIMLALDVSNSMLAEDIKPNRLARAKLEIVDLMGHLSGDEVGLVIFSGASFVQFPLTFDYATARTFLEYASPDIISRQGTAIADAIDTALAGFDPDRPSQKVIVILTDGENHEGDSVAAARSAAEEDVIIYTIGFGSPAGEPIPQYDSRGNIVGYMQDQRGDVVLSRLDEVSLQQIASETGGQYFRASGGQAIEGLTAELAGLQKSSIESEFETRKIERFQMFLLVAFLALVAAELLPDRTTSWFNIRLQFRRSVRNAP